MKKYPNVSVIIVTFQEYELTEKCLESVLNSTYKNIKVFLVDNCSDEKIYKSFYKKHKDNKKIEFIRSKKNLGFGGGCNKAIEKINEGYVVLLNNDTEVDKYWLNPVIDYMEKHPNIGACQPKIKDLRRKNYFEYAGAAGGFMDVYGYPFSRGRIFYTLEEDEGQYDDIVELVWCSGTAMIIKQEVFREVGLLDEIFFMYGEESDLCWRINHAGYKLMHIPESIVYHKGMGTMKKNPSYKKVFFHHRNGLILLLKNYTVKEIARYVSIRVLLDGVTFFYYLIKAPHNLNWLAVIVSYINLFFLLPQIIKRHWQIRKVKMASKSLAPILYKKSIVFDYFIKRQEFFNDLPFYKNHR
ncbi:glycosyltransferase family 2 protein [Candidatus Parcubacteria bacterium]|nr:MAG: glycosyltransferase family 2 protein [Candidatus Parcubacteria bacterium]